MIVTVQQESYNSVWRQSLESESNLSQEREKVSSTKSPRRISLTGREKDPEPETLKVDESSENKENKEKPARKRKWGSSSRQSQDSKVPRKTSNIAISTDSLKGLIPDVRPIMSEPVLDVADEEKLSDQEEDKRDVVKIRRTVVMKDEDERTVEEGETEEVEEGEEQDEATNEQEEDVEESEEKMEVMEDREKKDEEEHTVIKKKIEKVKQKAEPTIVRRLSKPTTPLVETEEPMAARRSPSPSRNPVNKIIHIRNLVRPFTLNQLKDLLQRTGTLIDEYFWIDKIKSHCFCGYEEEDMAVKTRKALHGTKWPSSNPKVLRVEYASQEELEFYRDQDEKPKITREIKQDVKTKKEKEKEAKDLEREKEIERRRAAREQRRKEEAKPPVREWDRDKIRQSAERETRRSKSPDRSRSYSGGSPSKDRKRKDPSRERERRDRERDRDSRTDKRERERKGDKKVEDEPPAKLLDDLFKKTKTTPCIYWLPLTESQALQRIKMRKEEELEREKRRKERMEENNQRMMERRRERSPIQRGPRNDDDVDNRRRERPFRVERQRPPQRSRSRDRKRR